MRARSGLHKRVAKVMASMKIYGFTKKRKFITTVSDKKKPVFPDLVTRHFNALAANEVLRRRYYLPADC